MLAFDAMAILVLRDLRLSGEFVSNPAMQPVDENTPLSWIMSRCRNEKGKVELQIWSHGLPGYVQCGKGNVDHPTGGPGITIHDLPSSPRYGARSQVWSSALAFWPELAHAPKPTVTWVTTATIFVTG